MVIKYLYSLSMSLYHFYAFLLCYENMYYIFLNAKFVPSMGRCEVFVLSCPHAIQSFVSISRFLTSFSLLFLFYLSSKLLAV